MDMDMEMEMEMSMDIDTDTDRGDGHSALAAARLETDCPWALRDTLNPASSRSPPSPKTSNAWHGGLGADTFSIGQTQRRLPRPASRLCNVLVTGADGGRRMSRQSPHDP